MKTFCAGTQGADCHYWDTGVCERQGAPEEDCKTVHHQQTKKYRFEAESSKADQQQADHQSCCGRTHILTQCDNQGQNHGDDQLDPGVEAVEQAVAATETFEIHLLYLFM